MVAVLAAVTIVVLAVSGRTDQIGVVAGFGTAAIAGDTIVHVTVNILR